MPEQSNFDKFIESESDRFFKTYLKKGGERYIWLLYPIFIAISLYLSISNGFFAGQETGKFIVGGAFITFFVPLVVAIGSTYLISLFDKSEKPAPAVKDIQKTQAVLIPPHIREEEERQRREQAAADERAFWNSPEGRRLRAERELAEIRRREREEAAEMARRIAEEEHKRQQEALKTLKDL